MDTKWTCLEQAQRLSLSVGDPVRVGGAGERFYSEAHAKKLASVCTAMGLKRFDYVNGNVRFTFGDGLKLYIERWHSGTFIFTWRY